MGHMRDRALLESRRVAGESSFNVWSNYLFCPSLCRSCKYFYDEESNWPFHCKAPNSAAVSHISRSQNYRQYDECPLYKEKITTEKKSTLKDDSSVEVYIGLFTLLKSLLIGDYNENEGEGISTKSRIFKTVKGFFKVLWILFSIFYFLFLLVGWGMIFFDDSIAEQGERLDYIILVSFFTVIGVIARIIIKAIRRKMKRSIRS